MGIVLVALLISIMNDTFDRIKDAEEVEVSTAADWRLLAPVSDLPSRNSHCIRCACLQL